MPNTRSHTKSPSPQPEHEHQKTYSNESVAAIIASLQRTQMEALREILSATPVRSTASFDSTLARCKATFSGKPDESVEAFIEAVEAYAECAQVSDNNIIRGLSYLLQGQAATWWQGIKDAVTTWSEAKQNLSHAYGDRRPPYKIYREIFNSPQQGESSDVFIARIRALFSKIPSADLSEKVKLDMLYGLLNVRIRRRLRREDFSNFTELLQQARNVEDAIQETGLSSGEQSVGTRGQADAPHGARVRAPEKRAPAPPPPRVAPAYPATNQPLRAMPYPSRANTAMCQPTPHTNTALYLPPRASDEHDATRASHAFEATPCSAPPHLAPDSAAPRKQRPFCTYCRRFGHTIDQCRKCNKSVNCASTSDNKSDGFYCVESNLCPRKVRVSSSNKKNCKLTLSNVNILSCNYNDKSGSVGDVRPIFNINILGYNGTALIDTGAKHCIAGHTLYALLRRLKHTFCSSTRDVKLADGVSRRMKVLTTLLEVRLENKLIKIPFIIFPDATDNETLLGIDFLIAAKVSIDFYNKFWFFSDISNVKYNLSFEPTSRSVPCASLEVLRDDEGSHLNPAERQALADVLTRNARVFEVGGGPTPYAEHRIDTGEHPPISVPPYRLNPSKKELMKVEIDKMLKEDIIEECESAWSSPALMVPKANGGIRFCVDYRRLNAITKSDTYPMPRIDELLQSTKRDCYMSSLDLRSSYWQVMVREADRDKTAFVCPLGTFRFKRMPFGLKNAPATFQRLIDRFRSCSSLQDTTILAYLDDILIISEGYERHLHDLEAVFQRLTEFNLQVNREKCAFARESVKYLGHVIRQDGVSTDPGKVSAVLDMKEPSTIKHLRTFLQTCSWFRKFIPNFSKVAEPLTRLTRKKQVWIWGVEQTQAFNELKRLLTSAPILIQADYNQPFILRTDASNYAIGAVLLQGEGNQERPIEYASRLLNAAERNYSTTEREALAVVWAVERFRPYIDGQPVVIGSDHQPLRWLLSLKSPAGRLVRWALKLQSFDIKFQYTPGKANVVADTLSRPICSEISRSGCGICSVICDLPTKPPAQIRQEQLADPDVEKVIKEIEGTDDVATERWLQRGYVMDQGVLFRYNPDSDCESPQLVIPAGQIAQILKELHDSPTAGHPGIDRTYHKVAQLYYFTGMRRIITDYVKACIHCQRYKSNNAKPPGLLQTPVMNQRNEVLAIDLFGPLPEGDQGERWILLVEDTATRWIELYALREATAEACAQTLIEEYFMRFGLPRRIISDNGVQFVSAVMRQCMSVLGIKQNFAPLYHPEANPAERKNRDLKAMLAYLVEKDHTSWPKMLPVIRYALNSAKCRTTGMSPAYLSFGREMRSPTEVVHDFRAVLDKDNFAPQVTPYLRRFLNSLSAVRERVEVQQDKAKSYADASRRPSDTFQVGDLVLLKTHLLSRGSKDLTAKFYPRRDGPYKVVEKVSPTTFVVATVEPDSRIVGRYHMQDLTRYRGSADTPPKPVNPKRKRGRPAKAEEVDRMLVQERGRTPGLEGEYIVTRAGRRTRRPLRYAV